MLELDLQLIAKRIHAAPECPWGHLTVKNLAGQIAAVGGNLPPACRAILGGDADEADQGRAEGFDPLDAGAGVMLAAVIGDRHRAGH